MDRPDRKAEVAVYAVPLDGGPPESTDLPLGLYSNAGELIALPGRDGWVLAKTDGTPGWHLPPATLTFKVSHAGGRVAWSEGSRLPVQIDRRQRTIWVAGVDGHAPRQVARIVGGDLLGWSANDEGILVAGRPSTETTTGIWSLGLDGTATPLWTIDRPRGLLPSPGGGWIAVLASFTGDASVDGLWILPTSGGPRRRLSTYGSYRWRSEGKLLLLPFSPGGKGPSVLEVDAETGREVKLLDSGALTGGVANNEWLPSPDGHWIVYLNAVEGNLWLAALP